MVIDAKKPVIADDVPEKTVKKAIITVVGLGYVGLPLAEAFSRHFKVIGFDMNAKRVKAVNSNSNGNRNFVATTDPQLIREADFIIIAVPTPVTKSKEPDLSYVVNASRTVSQYMKPGCTVILESLSGAGQDNKYTLHFHQTLFPGTSRVRRIWCTFSSHLPLR
jgi:UDPglucose 6-dehydrogenase/UDP-N-acetyl-D-galactosamine dehydrogenase